MKREDLIKSEVVLDEAEHTYTLDGLPMRGITGVLNEYIFADKYAGIPQKILNDAAKRGKEIHKQVENIVNGKAVEMCWEVELFFDRMIGKELIASEYIVSDNELFASAIDLVDEYGNLYDIKTTAKLDLDYIRWQLSIYAYFFELQNPTLKANKLYGVWLKDKNCEIVQVDRIDKEIIKGLLNAAALGEAWTNPLEKEANEKAEQLAVANAEQIAEMEKLTQAVAQLKTDYELADAKLKEFKAGMLTLMVANGVDKIEMPTMTISVKQAYTRKTIDTQALKDAMPDVAKKFEKESVVAETLTIKLK